MPIIKSILINFSFSSLSFIVWLLFQLDCDVSDLLKLLVLLQAALVFICAYRDYGFFSLYSIFLFCSAFFIYDSLFLDLINYHGRENFAKIFFPAVHVFSQDVANLFLVYTSIFVLVLDVSYRLCYSRRIKRYSYDTISERDVFINTASLIGMFLVLPVCFYKMLKLMIYIRKMGYVRTILTGVPDSVFPAWTNGFAGVLYAFFLLILMFPISKKRLFIACCLYLVNCFLKGFSGNRGSFLYDLFAIFIFYLSLFSSKKIKIKYIVGLFSVCFIFAFYVGKTRNSSGKKVDLQGNIIFDFLAGQTATRAVPLTVIEGDIPFHTYPFIFRPIVNHHKYLPSQRWEIIKNTNSIDLLTSYKHNPKRTLRGNGLGGAVIAEFIDCGGWIGVVFWTFVLAWMMNFLDSFTFHHRFLRPFCYVMTVNMIHNARGYFFKFISDFRYVFFCFFLFLFIDFFYSSFIQRRMLCKIV